MLKRSIYSAAGFYVALLVIFAVAKVLFMLFNQAVYSGIGMSGYIDVICAGIRMDCAVAAYFTVPLMLILISGLFVSNVSVTNRRIKVWLWITSLLSGIVIVADTILYSYWGFKIDTTPIFYLTTAPASAFASVSVWQILGATGAVILLTVALYKLLALFALRLRQEKYPPSTKTSLKRAGVMALLTGLLFIPIRGGFTVSTMNLSAAYFSNDSRLNHAAVNPVFSLLYSATHADDFASAFPFFSEEEAEMIFKDTARTRTKETPDSLKVRLNNPRPDIYLIILESFSSHLFPSLGGESIAVHLDSVAKAPGSLLFANVYASSFRTDRALTAILSAFPGQPTTSVMKHVSKAETLPSLAAELRSAGYTAEYYYGGDANFTNMKAYLASSGFSKLISDVDFPVADRMSKWGAHDDRLFAKVIGNIVPYSPDSPHFRVIQTSSSHEPFEVPFEPATGDEPAEVTAFRFADFQAAGFVDYIHSDSSLWDNSLVIIVPDHYGCYPKKLSEEDAHRIPLIFTGGALDAPVGTETSTGSQTDIAATLLGLLGLPAEKFEYSRDLLNSTGGCAVFSSRDNFAIADDKGLLVYNLDSGSPLEARGDTVGMENRLKAYLQRIYRDIARR